MTQSDPVDAIFLYYGILDAYEAVGRELIGENVVAEHVLPRMVYYVDNFLRDQLHGTEQQKIEQLREFLDGMNQKITTSRETGDVSDLTMQDTWEIRAAIFGFESVFIELLGNEVIKEYVIPRIAEIVSFYLPDIFNNPELGISEKLEKFSSYLEQNQFVYNSSHSIDKEGNIEFRANYCAFAKIHNSEAYLEGNTRFCPWGMLSNAIALADMKELSINQSKFTTRGSITHLDVVD